MIIAAIPPTNVTAGLPFIIAGTLTGASLRPSMYYADNPALNAVTGIHAGATSAQAIAVAWDATPSVYQSFTDASQVSLIDFSLVHPALHPGDYTTLITDGISSVASVNYSVAPSLDDEAAATVTYPSIVALGFMSNPTTIPQIRKLATQASVDGNKALSALAKVTNKTTAATIRTPLTSMLTGLSQLIELLNSIH